MVETRTGAPEADTAKGCDQPTVTGGSSQSAKTSDHITAAEMRSPGTYRSRTSTLTPVEVSVIEARQGVSPSGAGVPRGAGAMCSR
jgi:hypothetical protein